MRNTNSISPTPTSIPQPPPCCRRKSGFTLIEGLIAILLISSVAILLTSTFSFSVASQQMARMEIEAARSAGQIFEILRATSFDALVEVENGNLNMDPLGKFQKLVLTDITDRLYRNNLAIYLTIRPYQNRSEMKLLEITIASIGVSPSTPLDEIPPGAIMVRKSTLVSKRGINP